MENLFKTKFDKKPIRAIIQLVMISKKSNFDKILEELIQQSVVLNRLTPGQKQQFTTEALELPPAGKVELYQTILQEISQIKEKAAFIKKYSKEAKKLLEKETKKLAVRFTLNK